MLLLKSLPHSLVTWAFRQAPREFYLLIAPGTASATLGVEHWLPSTGSRASTTQLTQPDHRCVEDHPPYNATRKLRQAKRKARWLHSPPATLAAQIPVHQPPLIVDLPLMPRSHQSWFRSLQEDQGATQALDRLRSIFQNRTES